MEKETKKFYRHFYDNDKNADGSEKANEFLGEFEIEKGSAGGYDFETIGEKDGKKYKIYGQEISYLIDPYNAGTKVFIEEIVPPSNLEI